MFKARIILINGTLDLLNLELKKSIENSCFDVDPAVLDNFFLRMDPDYFTLFSPGDISAHIQLSSHLKAQHPVESKIISQGNKRFDISIVAFDYLSEFSIICGLLASFGFDIQSGHIFTFSEGDSVSGSKPNKKVKRLDSRKKIVDVFHVCLLENEDWNEKREKEFKDELLDLILLLSRGQTQEARNRVNQQVVEFLSRNKGRFKERLYPVQVNFHDHLSKRWTVMEIHSKDTPAFLYSLSNALSMRGFYIQKVVIEIHGGEVHDWIYLCDVRGKKIEGKKEQELLKIATVMIKQFTQFLIQAPDPSKALRFFDQMLDKVMEWKSPQAAIAFFGKKEGMTFLARLLGTSEFLWEDFLRMQFEVLFPILRQFQRGDLLKEKKQMGKELDQKMAGIVSTSERKTVINQYKNQEMFRIDMKHLLEPPEDLMDFSLALTHLAEVILEETYQVCLEELTRLNGIPKLPGGDPCAFSIFGLGKFGGKEMGYASDIELLFVFRGSGKTDGKNPIENRNFFDQLVQHILEFIEARQEGIFRIDLRLRPYGSAGSLASPLDLLKRYYSPTGESAPFERQALTKLRWVAGEKKLGKEVEATRDSFVYSHEPWDLQKALHLRQRQINELVKPGTVNMKYSPGGVIDIEYSVQYLQVIHGKEFPEIRTPSTLDALEGLSRVGFISKTDQDQLKKAYLFLRSLIDSLRMVRGNARDLVLPPRGSDEFKFLARRLGYTEGDWEKNANKLNDLIQFHMERSHRFFKKRFEEA